ncbi:hypothetical protein [Actinoplanes sp. NPDC020271]|uniref:hypothetical protein n=1 Tax=Actinoplanes sp. NPDC020271 TaxID=3363896 RepID=UPI003790FD4E
MKKPILFGSVALAVVATFALSACSDGGSGPSAEDTEKMTQYAKCMQQYGINIPIPGEAEPPGGLVTVSTTDPKALAARSACARLEPATNKQGKIDPAQEDRVLKLAACLRAEGIKAKDPAAGELTVTLEEGVTYTQQQLVDAYTTCNQQVPAVAK